MSADSSVEQQTALLYEKEVQEYLAANLDLLGVKGLQLVQTEYPIKFGRDSGRIDILAKEGESSFLVIEVKRGIAGRAAVGQLQSYMGAIHEEYPSKRVRGMLVAMGLDDAARAALIVTQAVEFFEFKTRFEFKFQAIERPQEKSKTFEGEAKFRKDYWEKLGGTLTDDVINCPNCNDKTRVVKMGVGMLCGNCGKQTFSV
jgi:RecB family endonuclease NucS